MEIKFEVGDRVYNALLEVYGSVTEIKGNTVYFDDENKEYGTRGYRFYEVEKILGFKEEKIKMSDEFYKRPKKPWDELKKEIEGCEKEWKKGESNFYLAIADREKHRVVYGHSDTTVQNIKYYSLRVVNLLEQVKELNYCLEFENWFLGKESKEDYPILTGLEPVGAVGYVDDILSEVSEIREIFSFSCSIYCVFSGTRKCSELSCAPNERRDKKDVYYKKVTKRA